MTDAAATYPDTQLLIDGEWRPGKEGRTIPVVDPATGATIGAVAHATREDLDLAIAAVGRGFEVWSATSAFERSKIMRKAAGLLRERADRIAWIMTREQGKPLAEARSEGLAGADVIDWFAEEARRTYGQIIPARAPGVMQMAVKLPVGPVAAFTPWNFPINQVVRKLSAALAAGCSIIVKGPEETPACRPGWRTWSTAFRPKFPNTSFRIRRSARSPSRARPRSASISPRWPVCT